jgi:hypothetical protein
VPTLGGLEPVGDFLGLLRIHVAGASEGQTTGHAADGDGNAEFGGDTQDAVFHRGWVWAVQKQQAGAVLSSDEMFCLRAM